MGGDPFLVFSKQLSGEEVRAHCYPGNRIKLCGGIELNGFMKLYFKFFVTFEFACPITLNYF